MHRRWICRVSACSRAARSSTERTRSADPVPQPCCRRPTEAQPRETCGQLVPHVPCIFSLCERWSEVGWMWNTKATEGGGRNPEARSRGKGGAGRRKPQVSAARLPRPAATKSLQTEVINRQPRREGALSVPNSARLDSGVRFRLYPSCGPFPRASRSGFPLKRSAFWGSKCRADGALDLRGARRARPSGWRGSRAPRRSRTSCDGSA
jgi:hypothetical protein